jgi:hypothetical protein
MSQDRLFEMLVQAAARRAIAMDELQHMLDDEVRSLSSDARVHDYIRVFAMRHLRERILSDDGASPAVPPPDPHATESLHARNGL